MKQNTLSQPLQIATCKVLLAVFVVTHSSGINTHLVLAVFLVSPIVRLELAENVDEAPLRSNASLAEL